MSGSKQIDMVAVKRGFIGEQLVEPGRQFLYEVAEGEDVAESLPWARPASEKPEVPKAKPLNGDTKPKNAQQAVKAKAGGAGGLV